MVIEEIGAGSLGETLVSFSALTPAEQTQLLALAEKVDCQVTRWQDGYLIRFTLPQLDLFRRACQQGHYLATAQEALTVIYERHQICWNGRNFHFDLTTEPIIYSIINCTPDSFYDGDKDRGVAEVLERVEQDLINGAAVIELGGKSTRPNYPDITADEEWQRLAPFIKAVKTHYPQVVLAIDTDNAEVMARALEQGVDIINDVDGFDTAAKLDVLRQYRPSVVAMNNGRHAGSGAVEALPQFFEQLAAQLLETGLSKNQIAIDPGVGFSREGNPYADLLRMQSVSKLTVLQLPILIAISRKSLMGKLFEIPIEERLYPTLLFELMMVQSGGRIIRVHDVKETKAMLDIQKAYLEIGMENLDERFAEYLAQTAADTRA